MNKKPKVAVRSDGEKIIKTPLDPKRHTPRANEFIELAEKYLIGQPRLIDCGAYFLDRLHARLQEGESSAEEGVVGSVLLFGSPGVGKTLFAKLLSRTLFGNPNAMIRIDGQEYSQRHEVDKLIGAPPGYIRSDEPPIFTQKRLDKPAFEKFRKYSYESLAEEEKAELRNLEKEYLAAGREMQTITLALRSTKDEQKKQEMHGRLKELRARASEIENLIMEANPFYAYNPQSKLYPSIVLFDEIEKAHQTLHNITLRILDEGYVQTSKQETVSFKGSIIIFTSNIAKDEIARQVKERSGTAVSMGFVPRWQYENDGASGDLELYRHCRQEAEKILGTTMMSRIDEKMFARPLGKQEIAEILETQISDYYTHLGVVFPIALAIPQEVRSFIIAHATRHPEEGARLLERTFKRYVKDPIDSLRYTGQIKEGDEVAIEFRKRKKKKPRLVYLKVERSARKRKILTLNRGNNTPPST